MSKKSTKDIVVKHALKHPKHIGKNYTYDNFDYIHSHHKSWITCPIHGDFLQSPTNHLMGKGCPDCGGTKKSNTNIFVERAIQTHGDEFDYFESNYTTIHSKIWITHKACGFRFEQSPIMHIYGQGCPQCGGTMQLTTETFKEKAIKLHELAYGYLEVKYVNNKTPVKIFCYEPNHGFFYQTPKNHLRGDGCPVCGNFSKNEEIISDILDHTNIDFEIQKKFKDCKNINFLPFDFYLPKYNLCIEYDGQQHFIPKSFSTDQSPETKQKNLEDIQYRDSIKTQYCLDNNIKLVRINYKQNIEEELTKLFIDLLKLNHLI